ncbi:serine/arginine-rich splicing factor 5-like isoform X2 [Artemia franciscana]|uniref:RRM domain-containing protein n=2 Tax=Artemia franciscana TaxID=6661 RepID=A0AA88ISG4_ARTSF|nr:hypothetical protein QYM36_007606 [Artemia franciscana]KAK2726817.1 hypothetical protein QYM36_007606 [Artemia franciscana]
MGGNSKRVFVGNLPRGCRERDVERFFKGYGRVVEVLMKKGYCFVEFDDPRDADDAVYDLNGKDLMGERLAIEHAKGTARGGGSGGRYSSSRYPPPRRERKQWMDKYGPPVRTEYRLIVENLSSRVSWQDLKDHMRSAGEVTYADAHKGNKNEGCIEFATYRDMKNAIDKLDDTELNGRRIRLIEDKNGSRRSRSRTRSRSRRRSASRSVSRSRSRSAKRSASRDRSRSRSADKSRSRSPVREEKARSRSVSRDRRSRTRNESRDRSRSPTRNGETTNDD